MNLAALLVEAVALAVLALMLVTAWRRAGDRLAFLLSLLDDPHDGDGKDRDR